MKDSAYKSVAEANLGIGSLLVHLIEHHLECAQSGGWGQPTLEDLQFCGTLHVIREEILNKGQK